MKTLGQELQEICWKKEMDARNNYSFAYSDGGPGYEERMKKWAKVASKWSRRASRVLYDRRLQEAMIRWI
jgi:hypothetical protein